MAQIVLSQVGASVGSALLPQGLSFLGAHVSGAALGRAAGAVAGRAVDSALAPAREGPRLSSLHVMESREGAGLARVYGRARLGGQVIWAARFRERRRERSAGKGGPKINEYSYTVSFAVAICEGEITRLDRVWANGEVLALSELNWRLYTGSEDQLPDPVIEATEGAGNAPAYRGTAYIVFEDLPLERFGNRLPQLSFEVVRAGDPAFGLRGRVEGVNIIPASGEFVYATSIVRERRFPGIERALNMNNASGEADFALSLSQLQADLPQVASAALTVAWFGDSTLAGTCGIRPGVETRERATVPYAWTVGKTGRGGAHLVSQSDGKANYGGTPADRAVLEGIAALKAAGIAVTLSPFLLMDAPGFPWRGRISVAADRTASARAEIETFLGSDHDFGFRHFSLHGETEKKVVAFVPSGLIGSEMAGLTRVRDEAGAFPFVEGLVQLAQDVKAVLGPGVKVSYAADWTEYGAYVPGDGSGDVLFPLDPLWASENIDFVGVDWYPPAGDWRDGSNHLDALAGYAAADDPDYLQSQMAGGEAYDWYYASAAERDAQVRTPITDTAHGEDWVFRQKDIAGWWGASHHERPGGVRAVNPTGWTPGMKPVRLIEIGFPAVDKGGNAPNLFYDPKSSESALPPYSSGARDDVFQRRALEVALQHWQGQDFVDQALVWAWDGRPWPNFPARESVWSDGPNWAYGHWLNGRTGLIELPEVVSDLSASAGVTVEADGLSGVVEGLALDGVMSLRGALEPLRAAFGFGVLEREDRLVFEMAGSGPVTSIGADAFAGDGPNFTTLLLDKQPDHLRLTHLSAETLRPGVAQAFEDTGPGFTLDVTLPLVMGASRAEVLAGELLAATGEHETAEVSLGPEFLSLEPGALMRLGGDGAVWQVSDVVDAGLTRTLQLSVPETRLGVRAGEVGGAVEPATVRSAPELVIVDGVRLAEQAERSVLLAAGAEPWPGEVAVSAGPEAGLLVERARLGLPARIGVLETPLALGPEGRWDEANRIELTMPGAELASHSRAAVLAGQARLLILGAAGWECVAWRDAALVGADRWVLSGLLQALDGTQAGAAETGAVCVLVDEAVEAVALSGEEIGTEILWQAEGSAPQTERFDDLGGLPLRVGHLRVRNNSDGVRRASWTRRDRGLASSWALPEASNAGSYRIAFLAGGSLVESRDQSEAEAVLPAFCDSVEVCQRGPDGRTGPWLTIAAPLS